MAEKGPGSTSRTAKKRLARAKIKPTENGIKSSKGRQVQEEEQLSKRQQAKELLAYLISREGAACTNGEISAALWEDEGDLRITTNRIRTLLSDLRVTFKRIGMEDALIRHRGSIAVNRARFDCDFFRMQNGDIDAVNAFRGEFMVQYSWAEITAGMLEFRY